MDKEKIHLSLDEIENKKEYYTQLEKWTLNTQGDSYIYMWQYISSHRIEELRKNNQDEIADALLSTHDILIKCIEKDKKKTLHIKEQGNHTKIAQYIVNNTKEIQESFINNYESPQIYIDMIYLYLDSIKDWFSNKDIDQEFNQIFLEFIEELNNILIEDITDSIKEHEESNNENIHPIELQMIKVKEFFQKFLSNFSKEENIQIATNTECLFFDALPNIRKYFYALYYPPQIHDSEDRPYNDILQSLQENIRSINYIFPDISEDWTHILSEELFKTLLKYISSLVTKPTKEDDRTKIDNNINNILANFIIKVYQPENKKDAITYTISLSKEFTDIRTVLTELVKVKSYNPNTQIVIQESIDTLSARHLFKQIRKYYEWDDTTNLINFIKKLQECDDKEIRNLLSNNELKELLEILVSQEAYEFAARIGEILGIDTK